jgi:hypothetical protein
MKLNPQKLASEPLVLIAIKVPQSMLAAIDAAAAKMDAACPNRSLFVRNALYKSLNREAA